MEARRYLIKLRTAKETLSFMLLPSTLIGNLKLAVSNEIGADFSQLSLVCNGYILDENLTLREANIDNGQTIAVLENLNENRCPPARGGNMFSRSGDVKLPANNGCLFANSQPICNVRRPLPGRCCEKNVLKNKYCSYMRTLTEMADKPCVKAWLSNPSIMSQIMATAPEMLNMMKCDPDYPKMLQIYQSLQRNSCMRARNRSACKKSTPSGPYSTPVCPHGAVQPAQSMCVRNSNTLNEMCDCANVQEMMRQFECNPKRAMKLLGRFEQAMGNPVSCAEQDSDSDMTETESRCSRPIRVMAVPVDTEGDGWESDLEYLRRKGFRKRRKNIKALKRANGNVRDALRILRRSRSRSR